MGVVSQNQPQINLLLIIETVLGGDYTKKPHEERGLTNLSALKSSCVMSVLEMSEMAVNWFTVLSLLIGVIVVIVLQQIKRAQSISPIECLLFQIHRLFT